jgi:5S rRNA maturation endonuclease (ribonuclease M5)
MASSPRFEEVGERWLTPVIRGPQEWMCECPLCEGKSSLQFNIKSGLWVCFRCDAKGNAKTLVKRLGGTYTDPAVSMESVLESIDKMKMTIKKRGKTQPVLEESYLMRFAFDDPYWTEVRGFKDETVKKWGLGYDPIKDRHTIAYRNQHGELLGIIYRLKGDVHIRYIYPEGFDRKGSLFGSWQIKGRKCALVEGSTDVVACDESSVPAVAQWGSSITEEQVRLLHELGINEVVLFYDYDEAGLKAVERSLEMLSGFVIYAVKYDEQKYCWHKKLCNCAENHDWRRIAKCQNKKLCKCGRRHEMDPGSLSRKERKKMYKQAVLTGKVKKEWHTRKSASSRAVQKRQP